MNDYTKEFLDIFKPSKNLIKPDEEILNFGKQMLPKEIIELWEDYGFGEYGDGIIKVIDPRDYMNSLYTWLGQEDFNKIPIMMTAFGDIFYYRKLDNNENDICLLDIHYRKIDICAYSWQDFFKNFIINEKIKKELLRENLYNQSVKKIGQLNNKEIYFFVPALVLGGIEDLEYLKKGNAAVHHQVLFQIGK